jgi:ABC-type sugar transport system ATPase subunit
VVEHLGLTAARPILHELSFSVAAGELVGVCGAMGSGRSALLATLFGCARGEVHGRVTLDDKPLSLRSPDAMMAAGVALVPEDRKGQGLILDMTVADNLALPGLVRGAALDDDRAPLLASLRVRGAPNAEVRTLSGGNQQKIALGKWLALSPRLLLLDEPTRGVDIGARQEIYRLLDEAAAAGCSLLIASSDLEEVQRLCGRVLILRDGRIVGELSGEAITEAAIVERTTGAARSAA